MKSIFLITVVWALSLPTLAVATPEASAGESSSINRFDGVWDTYGGIFSCNYGSAEPSVLTIRNGKVSGYVDTTDGGDNNLIGEIDQFGRMTLYVNGMFTLMEFKAAVIGNEGYGPAEAHGPSVICDGAWALKRRANPSVEGVHRTADGASARISVDFVSRAKSWDGWKEFEVLYESFTRRIEMERLKSILAR